MKALSIKQPFAELILQGKKKVELRKWNTKFRGEFFIHASKYPDKEAMEKFGFKELPCGFIVGKVTLEDVKKYNGKYGFILENPIRIERIETREKLGFWGFST